MALLDCFTELIAYTAYVAESCRRTSFAFDEVSKTVDLLMERAEACRDTQGVDPEQWEQALFPVCAWMDERILCSSWSEKDQWERAQLQRRYFNTTAAGEAFFSRLNALPPEEREVREVYAFCLALGFRGQYYEPSDDGKMEDIRYTNLKRVTENTDLVFPGELFPEGYEPGTGGKKTKRRKLWRGLTPFAGAVAILPLVVFAGLWVLFDRLLRAEVVRFFGPGF